MIFLTVGTQLRFDRLVRAVDAWVGSASERTADGGNPEVFGQIADPGSEGYQPKNFAWQPFLEPPAFNEMFAKAAYIVAHAGMGTIISALGAGKPILIMPRRAHLREQRNDHQFATAQRFGTKGGVLVAMEECEVPAALDALVSARANSSANRISEFAEPRLIAAVRACILQQ